MNTFTTLLLAELLFIAVAILVLKATKKEKQRKSHIDKFGTPGSSEFEINKKKYMDAIKAGKYTTKELACRDKYDVDEEYYKCIEQVYFE